ncbi:hypothetical protein [Azospirillum rugosum]|uniref:Uncharacterized protein n=1 Tax=Azospirillum rugosum TaxID=416170 RepID=A0ABS4SRK7_9PROT|nr:hypothetical protein [Azospirillum rugosum]MBP2295077.1 hypothetical protein [Azospirillum rugosum]MDQ0528900.1 hypothetical protein [Azospirillum rugosum]
MDERRNTDAKPDQAEKDGATAKPDVPRPGTKDELTKAQEEAAQERAENGGYQ